MRLVEPESAISELSGVESSEEASAERPTLRVQRNGATASLRLSSCTLLTKSFAPTAVPL